MNLIPRGWRWASAEGKPRRISTRSNVHEQRFGEPEAASLVGVIACVVLSPQPFSRRRRGDGECIAEMHRERGKEATSYLPISFCGAVAVLARVRLNYVPATAKPILSHKRITLSVARQLIGVQRRCG